MRREDFVTEEEIEKALSELNATSTDEDLDNLLKAEDEESPTNAKVEEEEEEEDMDKGYTSCKGYKGCYEKGGKFYEKKGDTYKAISKDDMEGMREEEEEEEEVKKGMDDDSIEDEFSEDDFEKALEISPILGKFKETIDSIEDSQVASNKAVGTILKGITEQLGSIQSQLDGYGKVSQGRKSVGAKGMPRFDENLTKGEGSSQEVSMSRDRNKMLEILDTMTFSKGFDNDIANAMTYYEGNGTVSQGIAMRIEKEMDFKVTR